MRSQTSMAILRAPIRAAAPARDLTRCDVRSPAGQFALASWALRGAGRRSRGPRPRPPTRRRPAARRRSRTTPRPSTAKRPRRRPPPGRRSASSPAERGSPAGARAAASDISGVMIAPGQTALTRIPSSAYSTAAFLVSPRIPCLLAAYALSIVTARSPAFEEVLTIAPPWGASLASICRIWCFMPEKRAAQVDGDHAVEVLVGGLVQQPVDADAGVVVGEVEPARSAPRRGRPAPRCRPRSTRRRRRTRPARRRPRSAATVSLRARGARSAGRRRRTAAPSRAKRSAHARPMPLAAPVTSPALPSIRRPMASTLSASYERSSTSRPRRSNGPDCRRSRSASGALRPVESIRYAAAAVR